MTKRADEKEIMTWMSILDPLWKKLVCKTLVVTIEFGSPQKVIKARLAVRRDVQYSGKIR
jgi:hypothetical protein